MSTAFLVLVIALVIAASGFAGFAVGRRLAAGDAENLRGQVEILRESSSVARELAPLSNALQQLTTRVDHSDRARAATEAGLQERMLALGQQVQQSTADVREEARRLNRALARPERRGAWGEMQLKRVVEAAGMVEHVHFEQQVQIPGTGGALRPDMVIDLAGGRKVVVDAKVSLDAFLTAETDQDALQLHAEAVASHMRNLASKSYQREQGGPQFVIMFLPAESLLSAALSVNPALLQDAFERRVVLATPTTLLAALHTISYSWEQAAISENAHAIHEAGKELYQRIMVVGTKLAKLGKDLQSSVGSYNELVASLESRLLPGARRLGELVPKTGDLELKPCEGSVRPLTRREFLPEEAG